MTTVGEWLASREPAPPPALRERLLDALGEGASADRCETAARCLAAGEALLAPYRARIPIPVRDAGEA